LSVWPEALLHETELSGVIAWLVEWVKTGGHVPGVIVGVAVAGGVTVAVGVAVGVIVAVGVAVGVGNGVPQPATVVIVSFHPALKLPTSISLSSTT
jgi:hypothetical protein